MIIDQKLIFEYAFRFRAAIDKAQKASLLESDFSFDSFPRGCCGDTCYLLGEYFRINDIQTIYVWGECKRQSHAWLVVKDDRVHMPTPRTIAIPDDIRNIYVRYGEELSDSSFSITNYVESDLTRGLIIDITADQFGQEPVYVDYLRSFHKQFRFVAAHDYIILDSARLKKLFATIKKFI